MRKSGVKGLGRLLSVLMVAALLMTTAMVPALALDRWEDVVVSVIWTDSQGQQQTTQAFPVPDSAEHAYWATLDASALFSTVQVQVVSSDPAYTFYLKDYASEIMWTQDATALDPMYSYEVDYYCNSVYEGMFPLYLSSQGMPETPAQESVNVPVYYVTEDGQQLDFQYASCLTNATTQVYANSSVVPWNYLLVKPASGVVDVFVDSMGNASPSEVRFVYAVPEQPTEAPTEVPTEAPTEPPVIQAEVTVLYQLDDNGTILDTQYVTLNQGDNYVTANSAMTAGYQLVGEDTVHVWVDNGGTASVNPVVFHYATPQPVTSNIDVFYYHENGTLLDQQSQPLTEGVNYIYAASDRVGGYDLVSENPQTVTLRPDGTTDLASVSFFYADPQPTEVNVPVHYLNSEGEPVAMDDTLTLGEGTHLVTANPQGMADGYVPMPGTESTVEVNVSGGIATPSEVYFYYHIPTTAAPATEAPTDTPAPQTMPVAIHYFDMSGVEIADPVVKELLPGTYPMIPEREIPGYELDSTLTQFDLTVDANGTLYMDGEEIPADAVGFYYHPVQTPTDVPATEAPTDTPAPATDVPATDIPATDAPTDTPAPAQQFVTVTIRYYNTEGVEIADPTVKELVPGMYHVTPAYDSIPGYELESSWTQFDLTVTEDGRLLIEGAEALEEELAFYYRPVQSAATDVPVTEAPTNTPIPTETPTTAPTEAPIPVGQPVNRYATINGNRVAFRSEPSTSKSNTVIKRLANGSNVYVVNEMLNDKGERWSVVMVDGQSGYIMSEYLNIMTQSESDAYAASTGATPVPTATPIPTNTPVPTETPTAIPTEIPTEVPTATPTAAPQNATITIQYLDSYGSPVANAQSMTLAPGTYTLRPMPTNLRDGYELIPGSEQINLTVFQDGTLSMDAADIAFWYRQVATAAPTQTPTEAPTPTPTAVPYEGYAVTTRETEMRTGIGTGNYVMATLQANVLVYVNSQLNTAGETWDIVTTLEGTSGYVPDANLRYVTDAQAQVYIQQWNQSRSTPTPSPTPYLTPVPAQEMGYAYAVGNNVPLRQMAGDFSAIEAYLMQGEVVYVSGQDYLGSMPWHRVQYNGQWGYVRYDMLRFMTQAEIEAYLNNLNATPAPTLVTTPQPYDPTNYSSYGYVTTTTSVNFRQQPSMNASRIRKLYNYAFCFVLGTTTGTDGETWYHIRYNDQEGYVNGKYFHWMTVEELEEFLQSSEYIQGIQNNTTGNATAKPTSGLIPEEDKTINDWKGSGATVSYVPWQGFSTPGPVTSPTTALAQETATPTPSASPTPTLEPLPTAAATYPVVNESGNSGLVIFIVIAVVLLLGGGGFAFMQYQKKQREVAMKAAQRRAQAARNADRPVARQAGQPQQMRTGAYTTPQQRPQTSNGVSPVQVRPATPVPQTQDMQNRPQVGYRTPIQPLTKPQETPSTAAPKSTTTMENPYARPVAKSAEEAPRHRRRTDQYRQDDDSANPNG